MRYFAPSALLADGWSDHVLLETDARGHLVGIAPDAACPADAERLAGPVVAGMANLHSHAFQRAMAGLTESRGNPTDSFWTWRELMYRFAQRLTPEQAQHIARWLYIEMLKAGYTGVAEFHYLHHDAGGVPYADRAEMSHRIIAAAREAGIALTLLPVLYAYSGFGAQPPQPGQRRFLHDAQGYSTLLDTLHGEYRDTADVRLGIAFHSLRAVDAALLGQGLDAARDRDPDGPVHIHIAEQTKEVDDCVAWSGQRPVEWLFDRAPVDARWCLVHATHLSDAERRAVAASGSVAGICPTTEADLGDGVFPAEAYFASPGPSAYGIGSDSHVRVDVAEELRLLEYGQRLLHRRRAVLASDARPSSGRFLYERAAGGGAQALGRHGGTLAVGRRADWVVLDAQHPALICRAGDALLDSWIFAGDRACVRDVMVGGRWVIRERRHAREEAALAGFSMALKALLDGN